MDPVRLLSFALPIMSAGVVAAAGGHIGTSRSRGLVQASDPCTQAADSTPLITADSIGPLDVRLTLAQLRRICPSGKSAYSYGEESRNNAILFRLGSVDALASQAINPGEPLVPESPADIWFVTGRAARLPSGLTLASSFGQLKAAYGSGVARITDRVTVEFCSLPRLQFAVAKPVGIPALGRTDSLGVIPDTSAIRAVWVASGATGDTYSMCKTWRRWHRPPH